MSTDRDVERIVRSWLDEGVTALPDRVLDLVLDQIPATPQRRAGWLARRVLSMNNNAIRLGMAAAVLVLAAAVGIKVLAGPSVEGPSQTPEPTPSPTPQTIPLLNPYTQPGTALAAGKYRILGQASEEMNATIPGGWFANSYSRGGGVFRGDADHPESPVAWLSITSVGSWVADPCPPDGGQVRTVNPPIGPSVDDLVGAVRALPNLSISAPVSLTLDGYHGKQIQLTYLAGIEGCNHYLLWNTPPVGGEHWNASIQAGWSSTLRILDVDGLRWIIITSVRLDAPYELQPELRQIVDSITLRQ